jgi:hypothetical protein
MKKYVDDRDEVLLCPFCQCRVLPYQGAPPLNVSRAALLTLRRVPKPRPQIPEFRFEMIQLTAENKDFWEKYACAMRLVVLRSNMSKDHRDGYTNAVKGFTDALVLGTAAEVWIAVGSHGKIDTDDFAETACRIEICMTVTAQSNIPFTTHMGIFRTPLWRLTPQDFEGVKTVKMYDVNLLIERLENRVNTTRATPNIACQLHAFAATRCLAICQGVPKLFMITAPLKKMMEIIEAAFPNKTTREVFLVDGVLPLELQVGRDRLKLGVATLDMCRWTSKLTDIDGPRPKLAISLMLLAAALEKPARVAALLRWSDNKL